MKVLNEDMLGITGLAINCKTREEAENLFASLDDLGYIWVNGDRLDSQHLNYNYGSNICYDLAGPGRRVMFGGLNYYKSKDFYTVVEYEEMFCEDEESVPTELLDFLKGYMK